MSMLGKFVAVSKVKKYLTTIGVDVTAQCNQAIANATALETGAKVEEGEANKKINEANAVFTRAVAQLTEQKNKSLQDAERQMSKVTSSLARAKELRVAAQIFKG